MKKMVICIFHGRSSGPDRLLQACTGGEETGPAETETVEEAPVEEETSGIKVIENVGPDKNRTVSLRIVDENNPALPGREAVKVRGIYISGPMAGSTELFQNIFRQRRRDGDQYGGH